MKPCCFAAARSSAMSGGGCWRLSGAALKYGRGECAGCQDCPSGVRAIKREAAHGVCRSVDLVSAAPRELSSDWNVKSVTRYIVKSGAGAASPPTEFFTTQHQTKIARSKNSFL